jgi:hypothetical protein
MRKERWRTGGMGTELRIKQKLNGINRVAFCFISVFFLFLKKN